MNVRRLPGPGLLACWLMVGLLSGCATLRDLFRSAGTYAIASSEVMELGGRGQVQGTLLVADRLSEVMMDTGQGFPPSFPIETTVWIQPTGMELATDPKGQFLLPHLEPGPYTISFTEPSGREIWARFEVNPDERLTVMVWVQRDHGRGSSYPEGTPANSMFPGTHAYSPIQTGSSRGSGRGSGKGGR